MAGRSLKVGIVGGGMFFREIIGQAFKDFARGGFAGALTSIGMSHLARDVVDIDVNVVAIGTRSASRGTAGQIREWFAADLAGTPPTALYGDRVWEEMLERHEPDVLVVATPDHLHAEPIRCALARGVHVIAEKPLCMKTAEVDVIIAEARERGLVVAVDMHKRYDPFVRELMTESIAKYDRINRVRAVLEEPLEVSTEIFAWAEASNPFAYVGCHWLDVVAHYMQVKPVALYATGQKNLLVHWDEYVKTVAERQGRPIETFSRHEPIQTWDSLDVNVTYDNGMRGDYSNNWINPYEFEGAVNQEIEIYGVLGRGIVDQQDRGFREAICGDGSRTRNPAFGSRIRTGDGPTELFGYGKASLVAGLLAIARVRHLGADPAALDGTYPDAASQRSVTMIIEAAGEVARRNLELLASHGRASASASFTDDRITLHDASDDVPQRILYERRK